MNPLANPYLRIALGAVLGSYVAPKIVQRFVKIELTPADAAINDVTGAGITGAVTALVFVVLGVVTGDKTPAT